MTEGFGSWYRHAASFILNLSAVQHEVANSEVYVCLQGEHNIPLQRSQTIKGKPELLCEAENLISGFGTPLFTLPYL